MGHPLSGDNFHVLLQAAVGQEQVLRLELLVLASVSKHGLKLALRLLLKLGKQTLKLVTKLVLKLTVKLEAPSVLVQLRYSVLSLRRGDGVQFREGRTSCFF